MLKFSGIYGTACAFIGLSVVLHLLAPIFGGLNVETQGLLIAGGLWFLVMLGLLREWRWVAYIAFIYSLIGSIAAMSGAMGPSTVPSLLYILMVLADVLAGVFLFKILWKNAKS